MISSGDIYHVVEATIPLYVAMILAYVSLKFGRVFTQEQCSGINKFVSKFSIPLLSFQIISINDPYHMNITLILSDFLHKLLALIFIGIIIRVWFKSWKLNWIITSFSLSTQSNTLILGIPLLRSMYGVEAESLLSQIVFLQSIVWYNLLVFMFELHAARNPQTTDFFLIFEGDQSKDEEDHEEEVEEIENNTRRQVKTVSILILVGKKLMRNPNFHATLIGFIWACIHFRWGVKLPDIIDKSIMMLATGGLGMAMFSLGLFMASRGSIIACGIKMAGMAMVMKFVLGPTLMAISSVIVGLRGTVLRVAIIQAALSQGIVPFVFAKEYNVHPDILSTAVIFGMFIVLPIALAYYSLLAL
ncbi:Auxin efflux carrier component 8 [Linum perenne]